MSERAQEHDVVADDEPGEGTTEQTVGDALSWVGTLATQSGVAPLSGAAQTLRVFPVGEILRRAGESEATTAAVRLATLTIDYGRAAGKTLGELLPGLAAAEGLPSVAVRGTRSRNVLLRMSANGWEAVARLTPGRLESQPNIGKKTVKDIVTSAVEGWAAVKLTASLSETLHPGAPSRVESRPQMGGSLGFLLPWLEGLATQTSPSDTATVRTLQGMRAEELKPRGDLVPATATTRLADLVAAHAHTDEVPLYELFPGLAAVDGIPRRAVRDTQARNCLTSTGTKSWRALARLSVKDIQSWAHAGEKVARELVIACIEEWAVSLGASEPTDNSPAPQEGAKRKVLLAAQMLAQWGYEDLGATTVRDLLQALPPSDDVSKEIHEAWATVQDAPLTGSSDPDTAWSTMPGKTPLDRDLLAHRIYPVGKVRTLNVIGTSHGLTRERVRQLEKRLREQLALFFASSEASEIRHEAGRLRKELGLLIHSGDMPSYAERIWREAAEDTEAGLRARALLALAGAYSKRDAWVASRDIETLFTDLREQLLRDHPGGVLDPAALARVVEAMGTSHSRSEELATALELVPYQGKLILWRGSQDDKGIRILQAVGEPMTRQMIFDALHEITGKTGERVSEKGFIQRLQTDTRVRRLGKEKYGLAEWGGEEYEGIITEMLQAIAANDDELPLEKLAGILEAKFDVSANSVRMYATGPQFTLDGKGVIRKATKARVGTARRPLGLTKRCFRLADGWAYRRTVDHDVLRGSGGSLPLAFAVDLNVPPGGSIRLRSPYGEIHASWPAHMTHIGSLRPAALALGAAEGDHLLVVNLGGGEVAVRLLKEDECASRTGLHRLAAECGRPTDPDAVKAIALALDIEPTDAAPLTAIRIRLAERGENDLLTLLDYHRDDGDDLLDELASLGG